MNVGENWKCSYCGHAQVIGADRIAAVLQRLYVKEWEENRLLCYSLVAIVCANNSCRKLSLQFDLCTADAIREGGRFLGFETERSWTLLPASTAKPQPDYIPEPIRRDYEEACAIRDLCPKSSATLTRRCIQGIIRDFCGISMNRLVDEICELRRLVNIRRASPGVQPDIVEAIDHVREIGNIGAHMEADINVIVDVDPDEAQLLIELTELLFEEWYVAREQRTQRIAQLGVIASEKQQQRQLPPPAAQTPSE